MARSRIKCLLILYSLIVSVYTRSLPLVRESTSVTGSSPVTHAATSIKDDAYRSFNTEALEDTLVSDKREQIIIKEIQDTQNITNRAETRNINVPSKIRPGQTVNTYVVELTRDEGTINARAVLDVRITDDTLGNVLKFHAQGITLTKVQVGLVTIDHLQDAKSASINDNILEIEPSQVDAATYMVVIDYTIPLRFDGIGIYLGKLDATTEYIAMNLHPTNARRVFPCMDEPNLLSQGVTLTFKDMDNFNSLLSNSQLVDGTTTTFRALQGPVHRWAMVAHSLNNVVNPVTNLAFLYVRPGLTRQDNYASMTINNYYHAFNHWTGVNHSQIVAEQDGGLHIMAVPDVARDWYGLSTLCIWEPYILMENNHPIEQRKTALVEIAKGMARQWFGWIIFPENWREQWVVAGLGNYAAYEIAKQFQTSDNDDDESHLDMEAIFTSDVIQESLLYDAYASSQPLRLNDQIFDDDAIRLHTLGLLKTKAPALLRMAKLALSDEADLVQMAAQGLLRSRRSHWVSSRNLYDGLSSGHASGLGSDLIGSVEDFLRPWVENSGYPLVTIGLRQGGVTVMQERFGFSTTQQVTYMVPLTFTTSLNTDFDNIHPTHLLETNLPLNLALGDEDWIIFNIQGQGYYRVNYETALWERLIETLEDEETRDDIHPLNRATLVDDSLNLARAGTIDYGIALELVLTMELETDYSVWKAFIRNMEFLRKRLLPFVDDDDDRDDDIYLRMVRRTILAVEEEIGFEPEGGVEPAMVSLTRGLVMEHACKAGYDPCIAAAVDMFFDPDDEEAVNPDIPVDLRPAVYCTMVREDEEGEVIEALQEHLEEVATRYDRLVILESFACSEDNGFIQSLLLDTINANSDYVVEERSRIFAAVASSSFDNSQAALNFLIRRTSDIRDMYGGPEKLDEMIFIMAENIGTSGQTNDFIAWVNSLNSISNLDDSMMAAERAVSRINENLFWLNNHLEDVYDWINENDASTVFASTLVLCISVFITLFNQH